jgi:hypothetical protein
MDNKLHIQEIIGGLDLGNPLEKIKNGNYVDALNVGFKGYGRRMGDLHPSPGMQPMNFVFRQRTQDPEMDYPQNRLDMMCERMDAFTDATIYASYDFGAVSVLLAEARYNKHDYTPVANALYIYTVKLNPNYQGMKDYINWTGKYDGDIARYEICEYYRFPEPLSHYANISMSGKLNDGKPTLYISIPNKGMFSITIGDNLNPTLTNLQNNMVNIKVGVEEYIDAPSYIPPGLSVYFFRLISRDANGDREVARSCFSDPVHVPFSFASEKIGPVNRAFDKTDFTPVDKATIKSNIQIKLTIPSFFGSSKGWVDLTAGNKIQIFAVRLMSAAGMVVNEKYPYARIEMIGETTPSFENLVSAHVIDGDKLYSFPQGIDMDDMIYQARSYVLFQCANTIAVKEGVFYAGGVYDLPKKDPTHYDARAWQFNKNGKVRDFDGDEWTLDELRNLPFDKTFNLDYVQCDLVNNWHDFNSFVDTDNYCMYTLASEDRGPMVHGASGHNVRIEFAKGKMHSGGVCPEARNTSDWVKIQVDQLRNGKKMGDPDYPISALARYINAPNYDVGAPRGVEHWWNKNIEERTGCIEAEAYKIEAPSYSQNFLDITERQEIKIGQYLMTDAILCLASGLQPEIKMLKFMSAAPEEQPLFVPFADGGDESTMRITRDENLTTSRYLIIKRKGGGVIVTAQRNCVQFMVGETIVKPNGTTEEKIVGNTYRMWWDYRNKRWIDYDNMGSLEITPTSKISVVYSNVQLKEISSIFFETIPSADEPIPPYARIHSFDGMNSQQAIKAWSETSLHYAGQGYVASGKPQIQSFANPTYATRFRCMQHDSVYYLACKLIYKNGEESELLPIGCIRTPSGTTKGFQLFDDHVEIDDKAAIYTQYNQEDDTNSTNFIMSQHTEICFYPLYMYIEFFYLPVGVAAVHVLYQLRDGTHMNVKATGIFHNAHKPLSVYNLNPIPAIYGDLNPGMEFTHEGEKYIKGYDDEHLSVDQYTRVTIDGLKQDYYDEGGKYCLTPLPGLGSQRYFYGGVISTPATDDYNCYGKEPDEGPNHRKDSWEKSNSARSAALITPVMINTPGERDYSFGTYKFALFHNLSFIAGRASGSVVHRYTGRIVQTNTSKNRKVFVFHAPEIDITDSNGKSIAPVRLDGGGASHVCLQGILWSIFPAGYNRSFISAAYSTLNDGFNNFFYQPSSIWRGLPGIIDGAGPDLYPTWGKTYPYVVENGMNDANSMYDSLYLTENYAYWSRAQVTYTGDTNQMTRACIGSMLQSHHFNPLLLADDWSDTDNLMKQQPYSSVSNLVKSALSVVLGEQNPTTEEGNYGRDLEEGDIDEITQLTTRFMNTRLALMGATAASMAAAEVELENALLAINQASTLIASTVHSAIAHITASVWGPKMPSKAHWGNIGAFLRELKFNEHASVFRPSKGGLPIRTIKFFLYTDVYRSPGAILLAQGTAGETITGKEIVRAKELKIVDIGGYDRLAKDDLTFQHAYLWPCSTEKRTYVENNSTARSVFEKYNLDNGVDFVNLCPLWSARMTTLSGSTHKYMPPTSVYSGSDRCRMHGMVVGHSRSDSNSFPVPASIKDSMITPFSDHGLVVDINHIDNPCTTIRYDYHATSSSAWFSVGNMETLQCDTLTDVIYPSKENSVFPDVTYVNYQGLAAAWRGTKYLKAHLNVTPYDPSIYSTAGHLTWANYAEFVKDVMPFWQGSVNHWCGYNSMDQWIGPNHNGYGGRAAIFLASEEMMPAGTKFPNFMQDNQTAFSVLTNLNTLYPTAEPPNTLFLRRDNIQKRKLVRGDNNEPFDGDYGICIHDRRSAANPPDVNDRINSPLTPVNIKYALDSGVNAAFGTIRGQASGYESHDFNEKQFVTAGIVTIDDGQPLQASGIVHNFDTFVGIYKKLYTHAFYPTAEICDEESLPSSPTIIMFPYEGRINVDYMNCIDDILYGNQPSGIRNKRQTLFRDYTFHTKLGEYTQKTDMYGYNMVHTANLCWEQNEYLDRDTTQEALSRVYFTRFLPDGRNIRPFKPFDYLELNLECGSVTNLQSFGQNLIIFQETGTSITTPKLPQIGISTDGNNTKLSFVSPLGSKGTDTDYDVFAGRYTYISRRFGTRDMSHRATISGNEGVYWIDEVNRTFCRFQEKSFDQMEAIDAWIDNLGGKQRKFFAIQENQIILTSPFEMKSEFAMEDPLAPVVKDNMFNANLVVPEINRNTLLYDEDNAAFASFLTICSGTSPDLEILRIGSHTVSVNSANWNLPCLMKDKTGTVYPRYAQDRGVSVTAYVNCDASLLIDKEFNSVFLQNKSFLDRDRVVESATTGESSKDGTYNAVRIFAQAYHYKTTAEEMNADGDNKNEWQEVLARKRKINWLPAQAHTVESKRFANGPAGSRWGSKISFPLTTESTGQPLTGLGLYVKQTYQTFGFMNVDEIGRLRHTKDQKHVFPFKDRHKAYFSAFGVGYSSLDPF